MSKTVTVTVTIDERDQLVRGLVLLTGQNAMIAELLPELGAAISKLAAATLGPAITVGVHGDQVQWVIGNPFPIRICDYDGEDDELSGLDERGQRCRMWWEPTDEHWSEANWRKNSRAT